MKKSIKEEITDRLNGHDYSILLYDIIDEIKLLFLAQRKMKIFIHPSERKGYQIGFGDISTHLFNIESSVKMIFRDNEFAFDEFKRDGFDLLMDIVEAIADEDENFLADLGFDDDDEFMKSFLEDIRNLLFMPLDSQDQGGSDNWKEFNAQISDAFDLNFRPWGNWAFQIIKIREERRLEKKEKAE